jgi:hypothetical protein
MENHESLVDLNLNSQIDQVLELSLSLPIFLRGSNAQLFSA